jgi:hypothetical protein
LFNGGNNALSSFILLLRPCYIILQLLQSFVGARRGLLDFLYRDEVVVDESSKTPLIFLAFLIEFV